MHEAKTRLSQLVEQATAGEEVVITRRGAPVVRLVPITPRAALESVHGLWSGKVEIGADFDVLPEDVADAFGAR